MKVWPVTLEKSGFTRYSTPLEAPGNEREYTVMSTTSRNSTGMQALLNFSIPPFTPNATMTTVTSRKPRWHTMGIHVRPMKASNEPVSCSGGVWMKVSRQAWTR